VQKPSDGFVRFILIVAIITQSIGQILLMNRLRDVTAEYESTVAQQANTIHKLEAEIIRVFFRTSEIIRFSEEENNRLADELAKCSNPDFDTITPFNLVIKDADFGQVLAFIMKECRGMILIPTMGTVDRKVTTKIMDTRCEEGLDAILDSLGLTYEDAGHHRGDIYYIKPLWPARTD